MSENIASEFPLRFSTWKSLLGFYTETEAMNVIRSQGISLDSNEERALSEQVRSAIQRVRSLRDRKTLRPQIAEIPHSAIRDRRKKLFRLRIRRGPTPNVCCGVPGCVHDQEWLS